MGYLYHRVPKDLEGDVLYPLNQLEGIFPHIFEKASQKYAGREILKEKKIPFLNCLWNDVIHLTAVHPREVKAALIEAGRSSDFETAYFQIDPRNLETKRTIVYLSAETSFQDLSEEKNFKPYNPEDIAKYSKMPQETRDYYRETIRAGKNPLVYHRVPHILYQGTINIKDLEIVTA